MAIEADLLPLGRTLHDVGRGLGYRQLIAWLGTLGPASAVWRAVNGDEPAAFTAAENRMADMADTIQVLLWAYAQSHSRQPIPKPTPYPRPRTQPALRLGEERLGSGSMDLDAYQAWQAQIDRQDQVGARRLTERAVS